MTTSFEPARFVYPKQAWPRPQTTLGNFAPRIPLRVRPRTENVRFLIDTMMVHLFAIGEISQVKPVCVYFLQTLKGDWSTMVIQTHVPTAPIIWQPLYTPLAAPVRYALPAIEERNALDEIRRITKLPYRALQEMLGASHTTLIGLLNDPTRTPRALLAERIRHLATLVRRLDTITGGDLLRIQAALNTAVDGRTAAEQFAAGNYAAATSIAQRVLTPEEPDFEPAPRLRHYDEPSEAIYDE